MYKKLFSFVLVFSMVLSTVGVLPLTASAVAVDKIDICHKTGDSWMYMDTPAGPSLDGHLGHGDFLYAGGDIDNKDAWCVNNAPTPPIVDMCPNLPEVQATIPDGYQLVEGQCVPTPPATGVIIVEKQTIPGNDVDFHFDASYDEDGFNVRDDENNNSGPLAPGIYSVSEDSYPGYTQTSAICSDESNPSEINLGPGETVTCVFTNTFIEETPDTATISAKKIVCPTEDLLPNWGAGNTTMQQITSNTATRFLNANPTCHLEEWDFQWSLDGVGNPGDNNTDGSISGWNNFSTTALVPAGTIWVREVFNDDYVPFTGQNTDQPVSAEIYCHSDVLHYDNWEFINVIAGETYHCVAFNAPVNPPTPQDGSVHIFKFIDGEQATPESANNASFPMFTATYNAPFTLDNDGWTVGDLPYEASTSPIPAGGSYTANEDLSTSLVGESCTEGIQYMLEGYSSGGTLNAAMSAPKTLTPPEFVIDGDVYMIVWNKKCGEVEGATTIKVHIYKYLDDGETITQVPDNAGLTPFPMTATWMTANLDGGVEASGDYVLGNNHGGATLLYSADTSPMEVPADYTTTEVTDGSVVVATNSEVCPEGKYRLLGYKSGDSLVEAEGATLSPTAPVYTDIAIDKYVIVVNEECVPPPPLCDANLELIQNGGFEAPALSNPSWSIVPDSNPLLKWLVSWVIPQGNGTLGLEIQNHVAGDPAVGDQHAELDGDHPVMISQDIATIPGQNYALTFKYSPRPGRNGLDNEIQVKVDGTVVGGTLSVDGSPNSNTVWSSEVRNFTAANATTSIAFDDIGTDTSYGGYIDDVSLRCVPPVVDVCPNDQGVQTETSQCTPVQQIPQCSDEVDNSDSEDTLIDSADPGCHSDGNAGNSESYVPTDDSESNVLVDETPTDVCENIEGNQPSVPEGMILEDVDQCVEEDDETPPSITTNNNPPSPPTGNGPISFGFINGGGVLGASTVGEVLGDSCGLYMEKHIRFGSSRNDSEQVKKLQAFLNRWLKANLPETGFYGPLTYAQVKAFQVQYGEDILKPWGLNNPTGLVYLATLTKINKLECPELSLELPPLVPWSQNPNAQ